MAPKGKLPSGSNLSGKRTGIGESPGPLFVFQEQEGTGARDEDSRVAAENG